MRSIFKVEQPKILNVKFKKFKKFKKNHNINKVRVFSFFMSECLEKHLFCKRILLLEALAGESFKINKFTFFKDNKKHARLGVLIYLKINIYKKKVFPILSFFFIHQLFLYYEFFIKVKSFDSNEYLNYFYLKAICNKSHILTGFQLFLTWADLNQNFTYPIFRKRTKIIFDHNEPEPLVTITSTPLDCIIFYKYNTVFLKVLQVLKKNMLKVLIFFYKKFFILNSFKKIKSKKIKLMLSKKYIIFKNNAKA